MKVFDRKRGILGWGFAILWLLSGSGGAWADTNSGPSSSTQARPIQVYKTPTCGCCNKWIEHLRAAGFDVETTDLPNLNVLKRSHGVPPSMAACHTALVGGYVVEGHVPASDIQRLLNERPRVAGLAVPGMPMGSPGMEHPDPRRHEVFEVIAFGTGSETGFEVFETHTP